MKTKLMKKVVGLAMGLLTAISGILSIALFNPITSAYAMTKEEYISGKEYIDSFCYGYNVTAGKALFNDGLMISSPILNRESELYKYVDKFENNTNTVAGNFSSDTVIGIAKQNGSLLSGGINATVSAVNLDIGAAFAREEGVTYNTAERFETYYQKIQRVTYVIQNSVDLRNFLDVNFKRDLYAVNSEEAAKALFQKYGTHLFTGFQWGGLLEVSNYMRAKDSNVSFSNVTDLNTKMQAAFNGYGGGVSFNFSEQFTSQEEKSYGMSKYSFKLYGGESITGVSLDQLFTYNSSMIDGKGNYVYDRWVKSINDATRLAIIGTPSSSRAIPIWELLPSTGEYVLVKSYLLEGYRALCGNKYNEFLEKYPISSNVINPEGSGVDGYNPSDLKGYSMTFGNSTCYVELTDDGALNEVYNESEIQVNFADSYPAVKKEWKVVDGDEFIEVLNAESGKFKVTNAGAGDKFILGLYSNGTLLTTISMSVKGTKYSGGDGTAENPYLISSKKDFDNLLRSDSDWNKCFKLTNSLNFQGNEQINGIIGDFSGTFDGDNYSISNLTIPTSYAKNSSLGLFACNKGTIKNLVLNNVVVGDSADVQNENTTIEIKYAGTLVGINKGTISNCRLNNVTVNVNYSKQVAKQKDEEKIFVGGLVGYSTASDGGAQSSINECALTNVNVLGSLKDIPEDDSRVKNESNGHIYTYVGGFAGVVGTTNITYCSINSIANIYAYGDGDEVKACCASGFVGCVETASTFKEIVVGKIKSLSGKAIKDKVVVWGDKNEEVAPTLSSFVAFGAGNASIEKSYVVTNVNGSGVTSGVTEQEQITYNSTNLDNAIWAGDASFPVLKKHLGTAITIVTENARTEYYYGEEFSIAGITVKGKYAQDTDQQDVPFFTYSHNYSPTTLGNQEITVSAFGATKTYKVSVRKIKVVGLEITSNEESYYSTNKIDFNDYNIYYLLENGEKVLISAEKKEYIEYPAEEVKITTDAYVLGDNKIVVECGALKASTIVKAKEKVLVEIAITTEPSKKVYFVNDKFSTAGMVVEATYNDGSTVELKNSELEIIGETITFGDNKIIISFGNYVTCSITVKGESYETYEVVFKNDNGSVISSATYRYGETIVVPANPTKASDNTYTYEFSGWDKEVVATALQNVVYTAVYNATYIDYLVTFCNEDGSIISSKTYHYGDAIEIPQMESTSEKTFSGWDKELSNTCKGNATYKAVYIKENVEYTVTFKDEDGSVISSKKYRHGETIEVPTNPQKESNNLYIYTFNGWDKEVSLLCQGNAIYTATYTESYIDYTITFKDADGTILSSKAYHYGAVIELPDDPKKETDVVYSYSFAGWGENLSVICKGNATYVASYTETFVDYTVTFKDYDGSVISNKTYHYGDKVESPANPTKASDNTYEYAFKEWSPSVSVVCKGSVIYTATYTQTYKEYTVTFKDENGSVISNKTYHYGDKVEVPADPTKTSDNTYTYEFSGWGKAVGETCEGDAVYTATYTQTYKEYTVTFKDENGSIISTKTYHYGDKVEVPADPKKEGNNYYVYNFNGWDNVVSETCEGDAIYTAVYTATQTEVEIGCSSNLFSSSSSIITLLSLATLVFALSLLMRRACLKN